MLSGCIAAESHCERIEFAIGHDDHIQFVNVEKAPFGVIPWGISSEEMGNLRSRKATGSTDPPALTGYEGWPVGIWQTQEISED